MPFPCPSHSSWYEPNDERNLIPRTPQHLPTARRLVELICFAWQLIHNVRKRMKKTPDPVRIGVLGCGMISQAAHFESCQKSRNARLYAICDAADDLRNRMAQIWEPEKAYSQYDELLADPKVEAVIIGIADQFHVSAAARAIEAGKHVLVEKPLGVSVEEGLDLLKISQAAPNLVCRVGSMKRFDPGLAFARPSIDQEIGARLALKAWYCD